VRLIDAGREGIPIWPADETSVLLAVFCCSSTLFCPDPEAEFCPEELPGVKLMWKPYSSRDALLFLLTNGIT